MPCKKVHRRPHDESMGEEQTDEIEPGRPGSGPGRPQCRRRHRNIRIPAIFAPSRFKRRRATGIRQYHKLFSRQKWRYKRGSGELISRIKYTELGYHSRRKRCHSFGFRTGVWVLAEGQKEFKSVEATKEKVSGWITGTYLYEGKIFWRPNTLHRYFSALARRNPHKYCI